MKKNLFVFYFLIIAFNSYSQSTKAVIKQIKKNYQEITNNVDSYTFYYSEVPNESAENGEQKKYTNNKEFTLIVVELYGETGNTFTEYYFKNNNLFFVFEKKASYNRPIYYDKEAALENNDTEYFNPKKTVFEENRYYFNNQELIRWLDTNKKEVEVTTEEAKKIAAHLVEYAQKALER